MNFLQKCILITLLISLILNNIGYSSVRNDQHDGETVIKQAELGEFFTFIFNVIRQSEAMRELLSPIAFRFNLRTFNGEDAVDFQGIEVHGLDRMFVEGDPKLVYTDHNKIIMDAGFVAKYIEVGLFYKLGRLPRQTVTGHVDQITFLVTLEIPLTDGSSLQATKFQIAQFNGYTLTTGNPIICTFAGSPLIANLLAGHISKLAQKGLNMALGFIKVPKFPTKPNGTKIEL